MANNITKYRESFKIRASEVDQNGKVTLSSICALFQEVAGNHALKLNFDITQLSEQNLTWVLHRMDIKMDRYPKWRDKIIIETWPAAGDALRAYRDYRILDESGAEIGCCLSYWMMINLETRRPVRMPKKVHELRLEEIEHVLPVKKDRPSITDSFDEEKIFTVRQSDLDMNDHVNNSKYLEWMTECLAEKNVDIQALDIVFLKETKYGDEVSSKVVFGDHSFSKHQLTNQNGKPVALAEISW